MFFVVDSGRSRTSISIPRAPQLTLFNVDGGCSQISGIVSQGARR
jgi:hypothetical protein